MAYDAPDQLTDGTLMQATRWNQDVVNNTIFLHSPPGARVSEENTSTLVNANEQVLVEFGTSIWYDTNSMADDSGAQVTQLDINTGGVYWVSASIALKGITSSGAVRFYLLTSNGFVLASTSVQTFATETPLYLGVSGLYKFSAGQSVSAFVSHNFSGTVSIDAPLEGGPARNFEAQWVCSGEATP